MAQWTTAYINNLPDGSFLYIESGGTKDAEGKTTPRSLRHFPYKDASGAVDLPHLRNALARIPQSNLPADVKQRLTAKAQRILAGQRSEEAEMEHMGEGHTVIRGSRDFNIREDGDGLTLEGRMLPYGEWTEINSSAEGHFLERFAPGALTKTLKERTSRIRVLFEHGMSRVLDMQPIAEVTALRDEQDGAYFEASLLDGVPELLVSGLRRGQYGSSVRFKALKWDRVKDPLPSDYNPDGLPEHTIREARLREFSVVTFPAYEGATAGVRSLTDEFQSADWARRLLEVSPEQRAFVLQAVETVSAQQAEPPEPEHSDEPSRPTQEVVKNYLDPEKGVKKPWQL